MQRRKPLTVFLLSLVTLGIYSLVWTYKTRKELIAELNQPQAIPAFIWLFAPWLTMAATGIVMAFFQAFNSGETPAATAVIALTLVIASAVIALILPFFWFYKFSEAVHALVPETETTMIYVLWVVMWVVGFPLVWPLIVQTELNKYLDRKSGVAAQTPVPAVATYPVDKPAHHVAHHAHQVHHRTHSSEHTQR
ncbi:MAG TPA: DUF4234 domain-containing protein [Bacillota bacterium]|nr:DUF4234 domain-containing protein [Bacillota bacterium]